MKGLKYKNFYNILPILMIAAAVLTPLLIIHRVSASAGDPSLYRLRPMPTPLADKPPYSAYKGISIGTATDEVRKKLGDPKEKSDAQDYYVFSEDESVQVIYDAVHSVSAISITYSGKMTGAPSAKEVFGVDAEVRPDGGIFKMVRYPKAGYWISYNRTGGDDPIVMIAIQKM